MEKLTFYYDEEGDILEISTGKPKDAISTEIGDDILERFDAKTKKIVGFTILNFKKRFTKLKGAAAEFPIPIKAEFLPA